LIALPLKDFPKIVLNSYKFLLSILLKTTQAYRDDKSRRVRKKVTRPGEEEAEPFSYNGSEIHVTISLGVATFAPNFILDETISRADKALYRAKKSGHNRVETETSPKA
jgi:diguanylate cyclase (GGDEF)-like protein